MECYFCRNNYIYISNITWQNVIGFEGNEQEKIWFDSLNQTKSWVQNDEAILPKSR